jgi:hypothetical protein
VKAEKKPTCSMLPAVLLPLHLFVEAALLQTIFAISAIHRRRLSPGPACRLRLPTLLCWAGHAAHRRHGARAGRPREARLFEDHRAEGCLERPSRTVRHASAILQSHVALSSPLLHLMSWTVVLAGMHEQSPLATLSREHSMPAK